MIHGRRRGDTIAVIIVIISIINIIITTISITVIFLFLLLSLNVAGRPPRGSLHLYTLLGLHGKLLSRSDFFNNSEKITKTIIIYSTFLNCKNQIAKIRKIAIPRCGRNTAINNDDR